MTNEYMNGEHSLTIQQTIPNDTFYLKLAGDGADLKHSSKKKIPPTLSKLPELFSSKKTVVVSIGLLAARILISAS